MSILYSVYTDFYLVCNNFACKASLDINLTKCLKNSTLINWDICKNGQSVYQEWINLQLKVTTLGSDLYAKTEEKILSNKT